MKTQLRYTYNCGYCNKIYVRKEAAIYHEKCCKKNPENWRKCFQCYHLVKKRAIIKIIDNRLTESLQIVPLEYLQMIDVLYCNKKQIYLYSPINAAKKKIYEIPKHGNNPMPKECTEFNNEINLDL